jgi:hypothetical protein
MGQGAWRIEIIRCIKARGIPSLLESDDSCFSPPSAESTINPRHHLPTTAPTMKAALILALTFLGAPVSVLAAPAVTQDGSSLVERQNDDSLKAAEVDTTTFNLDDAVELEPIIESEGEGLAKRAESLDLRKRLRVKWGNSKHNPQPMTPRTESRLLTFRATRERPGDTRSRL